MHTISTILTSNEKLPKNYSCGLITGSVYRSKNSTDISNKCVLEVTSRMSGWFGFSWSSDTKMINTSSQTEKCSLIEARCLSDLYWLKLGTSVQGFMVMWNIVTVRWLFALVYIGDYLVLTVTLDTTFNCSNSTKRNCQKCQPGSFANQSMCILYLSLLGHQTLLSQALLRMHICRYAIIFIRWSSSPFTWAVSS